MSSVLNRYDNEETKEVRSVTLNNFIKTLGIKPDLIKMDTEGAEALIIPSSIEILKELNCPLYLSLHPDWLTKEQMNEIESALSQIYSKRETLSNNQLLLMP